MINDKYLHTSLKISKKEIILSFELVCVLSLSLSLS